MTVFLEPIFHFFGQKKMHKYKKIFNNFSSQKRGFSMSLKSPKNDSWLCNDHKADVKYISSKLQVWDFYFLPNNLNLNQTSELNESANHLAKNSRKKHVRKCQQRLQIFISVLISRDKNFILLLTCFGLIFTRLLTLLSLGFFFHYIPF